MKQPLKPRSSRRLFALAIVFAVLGVVVTLLAELVLPRAVRDRVEAELSASGFPDARFEVEGVGFDGVRLAHVVLAPDLSVDQVVIEIDVFRARPSAITLTGARFSSPLSSLAESSPARLLARQDDSSGAEPPRIRLVRSEVELITGSGDTVHLEATGNVDPSKSRAQLTVGSPLGRHDVVVRSRESESGQIVEIHATGLGDQIDAVARIRPDDAVSIRAQAALAPGVREWASRRIATEGVRAAGSLTLGQGGRIRALDVGAEADAIAVGELEPVDLVLEASTRASDAIEWEAELHGDEGLRARARGQLGLDPTEWQPAFTWELSGPLPAQRVNDSVSFIAVEGDPLVVLSGHARQEGEAWSLESIRGHASVGSLQIPDADLVLDTARMELAGAAVIEPGRVRVEIGEGSRLESGALHLDALHITGLDALPVLQVVHDGAGLRVHARGPIDTRMERLAVGEGDDALAFEAVSMELAPRGDAPIAASTGDRTVLQGGMQATAPRIAGLVRGRRIRARSDIDVVIEGDDDPRISIPLDVRAARIAEAESEASLERAHVVLPLRWEHDEVSADGRMRADRMAWRDIPIGPASGAVRLAEDVLRLDWRGAAPGAPFTLAARMMLEDGGGSVKIRVPRVEVTAEDPLSKVLASLTEMRIEGVVEGDLSLALEAPERGNARLALHGASVREVDGAGEAHGVHGELRFTRLEPLETDAPAQVVWDRLELGGVKLDAGSGRLAFAPPGDVIVRDMRAGFAGGELEVAPFRFAWEEPDVSLDLRARGIDLANVLREATDGRVTGEGKLDGRLSLRIQLGENRRILLGDGHLASRGPGGLQVRTDARDLARDLGLEDLVNGAFLRRRVLAAMEDFEYRTLTMNLSDEGTKRVRARVVGRGKRMPQELDMTLNFRGVQPLLDHAVRLWPEGVEASIEVGAQ